MPLRVFCGVPLAEAAEVVGLATSTVDVYPPYTRAWLHVEFAARGLPRPGPDPRPFKKNLGPLLGVLRPDLAL